MTTIARVAAFVLLPVLVATQHGYQNLCRLVTRMKMRAAKGEGALALDEEGARSGVRGKPSERERRPILCGGRRGILRPCRGP